jgi:hypothetical protein
VRRLCVGLLLGTAPFAASAQSPGLATPDSVRSSITGVVRDSLGLPVVGASVLITPGGLIFRTDTAGTFNARNITPGALTIGIRKLGFSPLQSTVALHVGADLAIDLVMQRLPQMLAEVEVRADRQCSRFSIEGILCRRESGMGYFMNRQEVLERSKGIYHRNLVLRDVPGFRQNLNGNPTTVESIVGWRCIRWIYDGGFPYSYNPMPNATDIYAVEVYQPPDIPREYQHQYWGKSGKMSAPCTLVVMWSMREAQRGLRRMADPKK